MSRLSLNILFGLTLVLFTVPATFLGRLLAELLLSLYFFVTAGRFPLYDAIFNTTFGMVIKEIVTEGLILFAGLWVTAACALFLFRKRHNEIYFGRFWSVHYLFQITLLFALGENAVAYAEYKTQIIIGGVLLTSALYWLVYRLLWVVI